MSTETRSPVPIFVMTTTAIAVLAVIGAAAGFYLGQHYRPRHVQMAQQPSTSGQPLASSPAMPPPMTAPAPKPPPQRAPKPSPKRAALPPPLPSPASASHVPPAAARKAKVKKAVTRSPRKTRVAVTKRLRPVTKRLRPVAKMPPVRVLPVPRHVRQERIARAMAASRPHPVRMAALPPPRRAIRVHPRPVQLPHRRRPRVFRVIVIPSSWPGPAALRLRPSAQFAPSLTLVRASQRVRYVEQAVVLEGRPATLTTYIVWAGRQPRTFSFVRQDRRTDLARIIRVDEAARQVKVLVPSRGAVIQVEVPAAAVVAYGQALRTDPPSPDLLARADALLNHGQIGPILPLAPPSPPQERVAGMREQMLELVGLVRRVDPASRRIVLAGPRKKTPFRVAEGVDLPALGQIVSISTPPDAHVSPRPALSVTPLQPTVAGIVIQVRPTAVKLSVRTVTPEGRVQEVPVPVSGEARVFISGQPGDLRALKQGIYIRAYMMPNGETRILGLPSEAD